MFYLQPLTLTLLLGFLFLGVSALQTLSPSTTTVVPLIVSKKDNSSEVNKTNQETSAKEVKNAEISPSPPPSMPKGPRAYTTQPPSTDEKASGAKNKSSIGIKDTSSKMLSDEEWGSIEFSAMNEKGKALVMILWTNFTAALFIGPKSDRCLTLLQIQSLTHSGMWLLKMPTQTLLLLTPVLRKSP